MTTFAQPGRSRSARTTSSFSSGVCSAYTSSIAGAARHLGGDLGPVAGHERDVPDAGLAEIGAPASSAPGRRRSPITMHGREVAVDADEDLGAAGLVVAVVRARLAPRAG